MNGDGKPDLVMANAFISPNNAHGGVGVLLGNGDGSFQPAKVFELASPFAGSVAVADVNRDDKLDVVIITGGTCPPHSCFGLVAVLLGHGDGTLGAPQVYSSGAFAARDLAVADVNGDGNPDLLVANGAVNPDLTGSGSVGVLLGKSDGTFLAAQTFDSGSSILMSLAVADVNMDGKLDLLTAHESAFVGVLLGNGDGTFQAAYSAAGVTAESIVSADVSGDDKLDLLVATTDSHGAAAGVLLGNGDGTFQPLQNYYTGIPNLTSIAAADVDGDGQLDLLLAHRACGSCNGAVSVLPGDGNGTFMAPLRYTSGGGKADAIAVADVNGDRKPDVLVANECLSYTDCSSGNAGVLLGWAVKTDTALASSLNPSIYGQQITWTATVTTFRSVPPTGKVIFRWSRDGQNREIGGAPLDASGIAVLTRSTLNVPFGGPYPIVAVYLGDTMNLRSTSDVLLQDVLHATSTASITSSPNPSNPGQGVTFTATITSPTLMVTGPVTFTAGNTALGTAQLNRGVATFTTSELAPGSTLVQATYPGNSNIAASTSPALRQVVNPTNRSETLTTLSSNLNPSIYGQAVTFMAMVTSSGSNRPTGSVVFRSSQNGAMSHSVLPRSMRAAWLPSPGRI